jgi:hypothetical protein
MWLKKPIHDSRPPADAPMPTMNAGNPTVASAWVATSGSGSIADAAVIARFIYSALRSGAFNVQTE